VTDEIARVAPAFTGATADFLRQARDGAVLPISEHRSEVVLRTSGLTILADDGPGASWEPIRSAGAAVDEAEADGAGPETTLPPAAELAPRIPTVVWDRQLGSTEIPARDAYALRLVTGRTLYDWGRAVSSSPSLVGLVGGVTLVVSVTDLNRIGVADGAIVKVTSSRKSLDLPVRVDPLLPAGVARLSFSPGAPGAADLIDISSPVTDVRVETLR
jgi:anaerobic selenocysteine-containing dehydrogenase